MNVIQKVRGFPAKVKDRILAVALPTKVRERLLTMALLASMVVTFALPAFGGGYSVLQTEEITSSAAAIEDVGLLMVASSAFNEARKVMNATDPDAQGQFMTNTSQIITPHKWQNVGLIVGPYDALSGSYWNAYQNTTTLSVNEAPGYGIADAYAKYKAFGLAVQNLNNQALKSNSSAVSINEGLDAMSDAAIKLGGFGVEFLNDYNPGPVLISLYDISNLSKYSSNKLVKIVRNNDVLYNIVSLFGSPVLGTGFSFFVILNAVLAVFGLAISMLFTLLGSRGIGDGIRQFLVRIVVGAIGIYVIALALSTGIDLLDDTVGDVAASSTSAYIRNNLNVYDWYQTGFTVPGCELYIDSMGNFVFTQDNVEAINRYTYKRLTGSDGSDEDIKARMEMHTQTTNEGTASFIAPSQTDYSEGGEVAPWATDVYYAVMKNYAENKPLMDGNDDESSALYGKSDTFSLWYSKYTSMSVNGITPDGDGWKVTGYATYTSYGLNPISAFNMVRSDFSGDSILGTATVYPKIAYTAYDITRAFDTTAPTHMNSITRFIASFTLVLAAMKGLITIFTAGFAGIIAGGAKTATGSSYGLGQALGGVVALILGVVGISVIMSMILSLLDTVYGIAVNLVGDTEIITAFLQPLQDSVGKIPFIGSGILAKLGSIVEWILTLILALTFPKLGGIPITMYAQFMSEMPGRIAERAQQIESMMFSMRSGGGGGLGRPPGGRPHPSHAGQMGKQMMNQAFTNGARQTAGVLAAGAATVGSLAGASLTSLGNKLNDKADRIEGKPDNPGINGDTWDEMTPEQQAAAAKIAAADADWADKNEEAREQALKDAGVFDDKSAQSGSSGAGDTASSGEESASTDAPTESVNTAQDPAAGNLDNVVPFPNVGESSSLNQGGNGPDVPDVKEGDNIVDESNTILDNDMQESANLDQDINTDLQSIDQSNVKDDIVQSDMSNIENMQRTTANSSSQTSNANTATGGQLPSAAEGHKSQSGSGANAPGHYNTVNKNDGSVTTNVSAQQQATQFNNTSATSNQSVSESGTIEQTQAQQAGKNGASAQSMNGTHTSAYGKEMSLKEQRQARAMHALGDGLKMAGGNRTMTQGVTEAMGHLKDVAVAYTVPIEVYDNPFVRDIHRRRMQNQQKKGKG